MINTNLSAPLSSENHLSAEQMHQYLDGGLAPAFRHEVEVHLVDCPFCAEAMEGLALSSFQGTTRAIYDLTRLVKSRVQRKTKNHTLAFIKDWGLATAVLFLLILSAVVVWYQVKENAISTQVPDQKAAPLNGWQDFENYIQLHTPQVNGSESSVEVPVTFTVNTDSTISNFRVTNKANSKLEEEARKLLLNGPRWIPARQKGKPVSSVQAYTFRFRFKEKK